MPNKKTTKTAKAPLKKTTRQPAKSKKTTAASLKLPSVFKLAKDSLKILWQSRKSFSLIILIYGLAYLILVLGLGNSSNASSLKKQFSSVFHGHLSTFYSGLSVFAYLISDTASSSTPGGSAYQIFILIIASLSLIWALRQAYLGSKIRARDSYYQGLYPLAPYILILLFIAVELIPLAAGLGLYSLLIAGGIAVSVIEKLLSLILILGLISVSLYFLTSSVISLYIVTLPNMTPLKALRSAKGLVKGRRWPIFRKMIFLPLLLFIVIALLTLPFIFIAAGAATWVLFILTLLALAYIHSYLYTLYRGLINEQG